MIDESESGEAYDKLASQKPRLAHKYPRPRKQKKQLSLQLEARLVRIVMRKPVTLKDLSAELGIGPSSLEAHLKRLGLDKLVLKGQVVEPRRRRRPALARQTLTH